MHVHVCIVLCACMCGLFAYGFPAMKLVSLSNSSYWDLLSDTHTNIYMHIYEIRLAATAAT